MKAVVLAAGKGSRLFPVTKVVPKPLLPLANRPTLAYAFDRLRECGIEDVCIVAGENEDSLRAALGDGADFGVRFAYVRQTEPLGLAHALGFARGFAGDDDFVLYLGDAIYEKPIAPQVEAFRTAGCANLNLVLEVEDPRRFGVATLDGDRIVRLVEKPAEPESNWAMAGMYVFSPAIWPILPGLAPSGRGEYEITDAIQLLIDRGEDVRAGKYDGLWFDTGTRESFLATSRFLTRGSVLVGDGAAIQAELGPHVVVGEGAQLVAPYVEDTVVLPGANVRSQGRIRGCILGGGLDVDGELDGAVLYGDLA